MASRSAGFQNFRHARRNLENTGAAPNRHCTYLSAYWQDRDSKATGRETLSLFLTRPLESLVAPRHLKSHRGFSGFYFEGPDHLARRNLLRSQRDARHEVCEAARSLQFMDATGLKPPLAMAARCQEVVQATCFRA